MTLDGRCSLPRGLCLVRRMVGEREVLIVRLAQRASVLWGWRFQGRVLLAGCAAVHLDVCL